MSVVKALEHASMRCDRKLVLHVSLMEFYVFSLSIGSGSIRPTLSRKGKPATPCGIMTPGVQCALPSELIVV